MQGWLDGCAVLDRMDGKDGISPEELWTRLRLISVRESLLDRRHKWFGHY